jgi:hypothetical protein
MYLLGAEGLRIELNRVRTRVAHQVRNQTSWPAGIGWMAVLIVNTPPFMGEMVLRDFVDAMTAPRLGSYPGLRRRSISARRWMRSKPAPLHSLYGRTDRLEIDSLPE